MIGLVLYLFQVVFAIYRGFVRLIKTKKLAAALTLVVVGFLQVSPFSFIHVHSHVGGHEGFWTNTFTLASGASESGFSHDHHHHDHVTGERQTKSAQIPATAAEHVHINVLFFYALVIFYGFYLIISQLSRRVPKFIDVFFVTNFYRSVSLRGPPKIMAG